MFHGNQSHEIIQIFINIFNLLVSLKTGVVVKMTASSDDRMCKVTCKSFSCGKRMFRIKTINARYETWSDLPEGF